jgi:hypothetical protein
MAIELSYLSTNSNNQLNSIYFAAKVKRRSTLATAF